MKNTKKIDARIKNTLRRLFLQSEYHSDIIKRCKVSRGNYRCEKCGEIFKAKELQVHHIKEINLSEDWNEYIDLLFCKSDLLKAVCKPCHKELHEIKPTETAKEYFNFDKNN